MARAIILGSISEQLLRDLEWTLQLLEADLVHNQLTNEEQEQVVAIKQRIAELKAQCPT